MRPLVWESEKSYVKEACCAIIRAEFLIRLSIVDFSGRIQSVRGENSNAHYPRFLLRWRIDQISSKIIDCEFDNVECCGNFTSNPGGE
jgi:hypothetical protein